MSKIGLAILAVMLTSSEFGFSQAATATQARTPISGSMSVPISVGKDVRFFTIAKKCTIKRYRRPH
jgi:hypothetical protein